MNGISHISETYIFSIQKCWSDPRYFDIIGSIRASENDTRRMVLALNGYSYMSLWSILYRTKTDMMVWAFF